MSRKRQIRATTTEQPLASQQSSAPKGKPFRQQSPPPKINLSHNWIIGLILIGTFIAFFNSIFHGFAYDDTTQILQNETIRSFSNIPVALTKEVWFWRVIQDKDPNKESGPTTPYYRPLFTFYLMVGWFLFGTWAPGWHLINVLMHLLAVYFAFLLLRRVTNDMRITTIATLLFALHPLRAESVAWISGVTDLFLALFLIPSFYFYMIYREKDNANYLAGSVFLYLFATFAKEPAITLPVFIFAYEVFIINRELNLAQRLKPALIYSIIFMAISVCYLVMRYHALGFILSDSRYVVYSFDRVLMTIPLVICKYIELMLFPFNLSLFHVTPIVNSPFSLRFIIPLIAVIGLSMALWKLRGNQVAKFAILWFAINLLPVLNLSAFAEEFMVQERYVYIPSIGFSLLLALGLVKIPIEKWFTLGNRRTAQAAIVGLLCLLMIGKTYAQNTVWKDDITLWEYGAEVAPEQPISHFILGHKYLNASNLDKAIEELEIYMKLTPDNLIAINNLSAAHLLAYETQFIYDRAHADRAHIDRAIALCQQGLSINDESASLWDTLGHAYTYDTSLKNLDRAVAFFERGLRVQPENAMLNFHMGATLVKQQKFDPAIQCLEKARLMAEIPDIYKFIAMAYQAKGQFQDAINYYGEYLKRSPNAMDAATISKQVNDLRAQLKQSTPQS